MSLQNFQEEIINKYSKEELAETLLKIALVLDNVKEEAGFEEENEYYSYETAIEKLSNIMKNLKSDI